MTLGALVDAGLDLEQLKVELDRLPVSGYSLSAEEVRRRGLRGTHVEVTVTEPQSERHLHEIEEIIQGSDLAGPVKAGSLAIFRRLAEAEAHVHGTSPDHVHFHEVGAVDAIVDVVGAVAGLWLLGVSKVYASAIHVGRGTVECAHGTLPVPAPATLNLLQGVPLFGRDVEAELVTPTGAAIITTLAEGFGSAPPMTVEHVGYGAGTRDLPLPNMLRISIGEAQDTGLGYEEDTVTVIETNIDDLSPQIYEHVMALLFDAGALDVFLTPLQMKRNRPATQLSVILPEERVAAALDILFAETTSIGVRTYPVRRWKLAREQIAVDTAYGTLRVKVGRKGESVVNVAPEYVDCRQAAEAAGIPLKDVIQAALAAAKDTLD
jgi:uncharacterized protein (TIGR00299 family) protein